MKIFIVGIVLGLSILNIFACKPSDYIASPSEKAEQCINIYRNYLIKYQKFTPFCNLNNEITFSPDYFVYMLYRYNGNESKRKIGTWRTRNDTLQIYQEWDVDSLYPNEDISLICDSVDFNCMLFSLHYRSVFNHSFPRNVSAFRILNHGDSLIALEDDGNRIGFPISEYASNIKHVDNINGNRLIPTYWEDTLIWLPKRCSFEHKYVITDIIQNDFRSIGVRANNGAVAFNILNPRYYPQAEALPYAKLKEYCDWFDRVKVGDTISLELTRPAYEQEVFDRSPYLRGYPDTIYVLDNEAYGYWFAKPVYNNQ